MDASPIRAATDSAHSQTNVLIFDGDCGFCTASARWLAARGVRVEPWQKLDLNELGLTVEEVNAAAWWIEPTMQPQRGHLAIGQALRAAAGGWRFVGTAVIHPPLSWLARPIYALIARNRHRLPGATDACDIQR